MHTLYAEIVYKYSQVFELSIYSIRYLNFNTNKLKEFLLSSMIII